MRACCQFLCANFRAVAPLAPHYSSRLRSLPAATPLAAATPRPPASPALAAPPLPLPAAPPLPATASGSTAPEVPRLDCRKRPAWSNAARKTYSTWAFKLRKSSAAHRCMASYTAGSMRSKNDFRLATKSSLVDGTGVDYRLRAAFATQHDQ